MAVLRSNLPMILATPGSNSYSNQALDAAGKGGFAIYQATQAISLTQIAWNFFNFFGTPPAYRIGFETVNSSGNPTGTYQGGGNAYVDVVPAANGSQISTVGTPYTPAVNDLICPTVRYSGAGMINGSNCITLNYSCQHLDSSSDSFQVLPRAGRINSDGSYTSFQDFPMIVPRYTDGSTEWPSLAVATTNGATLFEACNSGSSPKYRGFKVTRVVPWVLRGMYLSARLAASGAFLVEAFSGSSGTPVQVSNSVGVPGWINGTRVGFVPLISPVTIAANAICRVTARPTTVNDVTINGHQFPDDSALYAYSGGLYKTTASTAGTWTDWDNVSTGFAAYAMWPAMEDVAVSGGVSRSRVVGAV